MEIKLDVELDWIEVLEEVKVNVEVEVLEQVKVDAEVEMFLEVKVEVEM